MTPAAAQPARDAAAGLLLGVDGGGTKTTACLAVDRPGAEPRVLGRGSAGSSNPRAVGTAAAQDAVRAALETAWQGAGLPPQRARAAVLAIAGAGSEPLRSAMLAWIRGADLAERFDLAHDADAVLAASGRETGVALIAGTGSSAVGVAPDGRRVAVGGWGWRWGDEGGAYWIGLEALRCVTQADDGRAAATSLAAAFCAAWQADAPRLLLAACEARPDVRRAIADLAPLVAEQAAAGDAAAARILQRAGVELARLADAAAERLHWTGRLPLAVAGGVAVGVPAVRSAIEAELAARGWALEPVAVVGEPVLGCLRLAARLAG